ncbi:MAG: hypothetical protein K2L24_02230 [Opitutales bacterium]|nr:hypothetical protein [Opitutales bacterium]
MCSNVHATRRQRIHLEKLAEQQPAISSPPKDVQSQEKHEETPQIDTNIIRDIVMVTKRNRDFYYWSTILATKGKTNEVAPNRFQYYVIGAPDPHHLAGHYLAVVLKRSLRSLMGHARMTVRYLKYSQIDPVTITVDLPERDVVDDRQIFLYLGPSNERLRAIGWTVRIDDGAKTYEKGSFIWRRLLPKYDGSPLTERPKKP